LQPDEIIGRVVSMQRGKRRVTIFGSFPGRIYAIAIGIGKSIETVLASMFRPAYHWFAKTGIFRKLFSRWIRTRVSCFTCGDGVEMQLHLGRRMLGRLQAGKDKWYIRRPFRLFIDESALPKGEDVEGVKRFKELNS
jgi:hypothetical protein